MKQQSCINEPGRPTTTETVKATLVSELVLLRDHEVAAVTFHLTKQALQPSLPSTIVPPLSFLCRRKRENNSEKETNQRRIDFLIPMDFFPVQRALTHQRYPLQDEQSGA